MIYLDAITHLRRKKLENGVWECESPPHPIFRYIFSVAEALIDFNQANHIPPNLQKHQQQFRIRAQLRCGRFRIAL